MERKKQTIALAAGVSAVLVASSAAFAIANGIFRGPTADRVGTFQAVEQLLPAESPTTSLSSPTSSVAAGVPPPTLDDGSTATQEPAPAATFAAPAPDVPGHASAGGQQDEPGDEPANEPTTVPVAKPSSTTTPTTVSTSSTVPDDHHDGEDDGHESEPEDHGSDGHDDDD